MNKSDHRKSEAEWKTTLGEERYNVLRKGGTEAPFSGKFNAFFEEGIYYCGACQSELFTSAAKFDAHCGWPSFDAAIDLSKIEKILDKSHGMIRTEIRCGNCKSHLGHLFDDGPTETGQRYCVNSASLDFREKK